MNNNLVHFITFLSRHDMIDPSVIAKDSEEGFINRLKLQKYTYLAKYFGLDMGYNYTMYLHGPYSPTLTDDYYELEAIHALRPQMSIRPLGGFERLKFINFLNDKDSDWLEVASTLLSLRGYFKDKECLLERTTNMKDHIPKTKIESTLTELENHKLIAF